MDKLDEALFALGEEQAKQACLDAKKARILALAWQGKRAKRSWLAYACAAATLILGLAAGVLVEHEGWLYATEPYYSIPKTDGAEILPEGYSLDLQPQWNEYTAADIPLANAPTTADIQSYWLSYIPGGMTAKWEHELGLLEVSDAQRTRSILAKPCLRYELLPQEREGLAVGYARARYTQSDDGRMGGVNWALRLNEDVYLYVSTEGMTYDESLLFIQGIQTIDGGSGI